MSQETNNSFTELNTDLHPYNTPPTVMTDAVNATITTDGENQFILQNIKSNELVAQLTPGFQPLGIAVHKNIAYIISGEFDSDGVFLKGEIGTYPSPQWNDISSTQRGLNYPMQQAALSGKNPPSSISQNFLPLINQYSPLYNFLSGNFTKPSGSGLLDGLIDNYLASNLLPDNPTNREIAGNIILNNDGWYTEPFRTNKFNFKNDRLIEIELQESYDNSINIIFTDDSNKVRLINSRFILSEDGKSASLADRRQTKDTNTYSEVRFFSSNLLRTSDKIADLNFVGVFEGGQLPCGNYKIYLKYSDTDGALSDLIEESRLITVGLDNRGGKSNEVSNKYIHLTLNNLDYKFSSVKVYYSYFTGDTDSVGVLKEVNNLYSIPSSGIMDIFLYGNEIINDIDINKFNLEYSSINNVKSLTQHDDRLIDANINNLNTELDILRDISQQIAISTTDVPMVIKGLNKGYSDPYNVYNNLGVWAGETYEVGICYILKDGKGVTPVFPLRGIDDYEKISPSNDYTVDTLNPLLYEKINSLDGYYKVSSGLPNIGEQKKENRLGVYRTPKKRNLLVGGINPGNGNGLTTGIQRFGDSTEVRYLYFDTKILFNQTKKNPYLQFINNNIEGFFFVKKERKKDCIAQGIVTNSNYVSLYPIVNNNSSQDYYYDRVHLMQQPFAWNHGMTSLNPSETNTLDINVDGKYVPHPGQLSEFAVTTKEDGTSIRRWGYRPGQYQNPFVINTQGGNNISFQFNSSTSRVEDAHYVFYTPDMLVNAPLMASLFNNNKKGMMLNQSAIKMGAIIDSTKTYNPFSPLNTGFYNNKILTVLELNNFSIDLINPNTYGYHRNMSDNYFQYINEYQDAFIKKQFSAISNRNSYCRISRMRDPNSISGLNYSYSYTDINFPITPALGYPDYTNTAGLAVDSVRFSDFIGLKCVSKDPTLSFNDPSYGLPPVWAGSAPDILVNLLSAPSLKLSSYPGMDPSALTNNTYSMAERWIDRIQFQGFNFGVLANIYNSEFGAIAPSSLTNDDWKNKYSNNNNSEAYYAFSKRIPLKDFRVSPYPGYPYFGLFGLAITTGGDCFINYSYKRAWYSHGIDGVPTASDSSLYQDYNLDTGLVERGLVFPMVCESNYNISMRTFQFKDAVEQNLYGQDRAFYPLDPINHIRSTRQLESKGYNFGYNDNNSVKNYLNLDDNAPAFGLSYDTRILISSPSISGSFVNGYTDFSGLNFRDYAKNLGQINKVISQNGTLFCIQENGVSVVPMNQRTMVSQQQGGVFLDDGQLLGQKLLYISTEYGSDQQFSVIKSDNYIYGCSFDKNKIWRIESVEGGGKTLKTISDFKIQKLLNKFKKRCLANIGTKPFVKSNYDRRTNTIIFTYFVLESNSKFSTDANINTNNRISSIGSVYFNETTGKWVSTLSWDPLFMFNLGSEVFSFNSKKDQDKIWKHFSDNSVKCNFYGKQEKFEFEFIIVDDSSKQKILNNMLVVCNREFPGRLTLTVDDDVILERPDTWNQTPGIGSYTGPNIISTTQLMRQRHEDFKYNILGFTSNQLKFEMSVEEAERLKGAWFKFNNVIYIFGNHTIINSTQLYIEILDQNLILVNSIPNNISIDTINFGVFKQNMEYIEDHLYIEISKNKENSRIRDKYIKVKFSYEGMDYITIQKIISSFDYSFS